KSWTFYCPQTTYTDTFDYCTAGGTITYGWDTSSDYAPSGVSHDIWGREEYKVSPGVNIAGRRSLELYGKGSVNLAVSALIWDLSNLHVTTDLDIQVLNMYKYSQESYEDITYIQFEIQTSSGLFYAYYVRVKPGFTTSEVWDVVNRELTCITTASGCTPPPNHYVKILGLGDWNQFIPFFPSGFNLKQDLGIDGVVTKIAFVAVGGRGGARIRSYFDDLTISWRRCQLPGHITPHTRG
ncbi:MAG: hypothetical protein ACK4SY_10730, partial [Pyrobaculum sp.]